MSKANNTVYLLVGTRGAGKSHYCKKMVCGRTDLDVVSRDEILIRLYGSVHTSPYGGAQGCALYLMCRLLRFKLSTGRGLKLILDTWTWSSQDRKALIKILRESGANRVVALYFVTPVEYVKEWFWEKPGIAPISEMGQREARGQKCSFFADDAPVRDNELFHELAADIDTDGFDRVIRIDPLKDPPVFE